MNDNYALARWGFSGFTATDDYALPIEGESKVDALNRERYKELHERFADALSRLQVAVSLMSDGKVIVGVCDATNDPSVTPDQAFELALSDAHRKLTGQTTHAERQQHVVELPTMSMALGNLPADQRETAANVLLMCKQAVLDSGAAVKMGAWTEGDAAVAELAQQAMQDAVNGKTYTHEEAKQLMAERRAKVAESKPTCTDERPCVNCFSGQGECEVGPFGGPELLEQARALCKAIERLPAGEHQTNLISKVADATFALQNLQSSGDYFWPRPMAPELTEAAIDVLAERRRQVEAEGWTPEHDDKYPGGELACAAIAYLMVGVNPNGALPWWPWDVQHWKPSTDTRRNLIKAGALLLADLEWLDRKRAAAAAAPDDLTQFLEQTDFDAAEKVASQKATEPPQLPAGEDDCEGCKI